MASPELIIYRLEKAMQDGLKAAILAGCPKDVERSAHFPAEAIEYLGRELAESRKEAGMLRGQLEAAITKMTAMDAANGFASVVERLPADGQKLVGILKSGVLCFGVVIGGVFCEYHPDRDRFVEAYPFGGTGIVKWLPVCKPMDDEED